MADILETLRHKPAPTRRFVALGITFVVAVIIFYMWSGSVAEDIRSFESDISVVTDDIDPFEAIGNNFMQAVATFKDGVRDLNGGLSEAGAVLQGATSTATTTVLNSVEKQGENDIMELHEGE